MAHRQLRDQDAGDLADTSGVRSGGRRGAGSNRLATKIDMADLSVALGKEAASANASLNPDSPRRTSVSTNAGDVLVKNKPTDTSTADWMEEELKHWEEERKRVAKDVHLLLERLQEESDMEAMLAAADGGGDDSDDPDSRGGSGHNSPQRDRRDSAAAAADSGKPASPALMKRVKKQSEQRRTIGVGQPHSHFFAEELAEMRKKQDRIERMKQDEMTKRAAGAAPNSLPAHMRKAGNRASMHRAGNRGSLILSKAQQLRLSTVAAPKEPYTIADDPTRIVKTVPPPADTLLGLADIMVSDNEVNCLRVRDHFLKEGRLTVEAAQWLCTRAGEIMREEPNLLTITAPLNVVGDIHGQFFDLVFLLDQAGEPGPQTKYLFLGDYVDRGCFGCETVFYLWALKITYPDRIFMLRGNHESRLLAQHFNFESEAIHKYDEDTHDAIQDTFDTLPLCALLIADCGRFFAVHGGLSPDMVVLDDILPVNRFEEPPERGPFCDLLWSDPAEETSALGLSPAQLAQWHRKSYDPNPVRGCSYIYGYSAVRKFLDDNDLKCIIRAHEVQKQGYKLHRFCRAGQQDPLVITLFSAPNYCDMYENWGSWLSLTHSGYTFGQIAWSEHPYWLPRFQNALNFTFPFVLENLMKVMADVLTAVGELGADEEDKDVEDLSTKRSRAMGRIAIMMKKVRLESEKNLRQVDLDERDKFSGSLRIDLGNERRPKFDDGGRKRAQSF